MKWLRYKMDKDIFDIILSVLIKVASDFPIFPHPSSGVSALLNGSTGPSDGSPGGQGWFV